MTSFYDPLTNVRNRRGGQEMVNEIMSGMTTYMAIGVIMIDIDYFKKFNDMLGHDAGDECLKVVAQTIDSCMLEENGFVIRHGGEEFVALIFGAKREKLLSLAKAIIAAVENNKYETSYKEVSQYVTISAGAAIESRRGRFNYEDILKGADENLYLAKKNGRNQVYF